MQSRTATRTFARSIHGSALLSLVAFAPAVIAQPGIIYRAIAPAKFDIVKIDPSPAAANQPFAILVQLTNRRNAPLTIALSSKTDATTPTLNVNLESRESRLVELRGRFVAVGWHDVVISASWQTGDSMLVRVGPTKIERRLRFESLGDRTSPVQVYAAQSRPEAVDLGPDAPNEENGGTVAAGVIGFIEGTRDALFAVSKTAGIWRSVNDGPWEQLKGSPPRAFSLAIDPANSSRIFVGERDDDAADPRLRGSGLWLSDDFGNSWVKVYDGLAATGSQAIPSLAVAPGTSTLLFATRRSVGRLERRFGTGSIEISFGQRDPGDPGCNTTVPRDLGAITAVAVSPRRVWARSTRELFFSDDDGRTFHCRMLPTTVNIPGFPNMQADYNTAPVGGNDNLALAAFDDRAYLIFMASVLPSDPRAVADAGCNPASSDFDAAKRDCHLNNISPLLTFVVNGESEAWVAQNTGDNDGRGLNGRRFVKTVQISPAQCPTSTEARIGAERQLIYGSGQSLQQALGELSDNRIQWDVPVFASAGGPPPPGKYAPMHSDLWDVLLPWNYCPRARPDVFVATDGGVYRGRSPALAPLLGPMGSSGFRLTDLTWTTRSFGLRTHTAQNLLVIESKTVPAPVPGRPLAPIRNVAYPTQDNEGWWRRQNGTWSHTSGLGDANYVVGDIGGTSALIWRQLTPGMAFLVDDGGDKRITLNSNQSYDGPTSIQAIQSLATEPLERPSMDLVMLVSLPLKDADGKVVPGPLGAGTARAALIRNADFAANPDGPAAKFTGWSIVSDALPPGSRRFWVSGGHSTPQFYLYADGSNATCPDGLFRLVWKGIAGFAVRSWNCIIKDLSPAGGSLHGPAFVNPFDPDIVVVSRAKPSASIEISIDGGGNFCPMPALTALVTGSGLFTFATTFDPSGTFNELGSRYHGNGFSVPTQVAFNRHAPSQMIAASPYTGLFVTRPPLSGGPAPSCTAAGWKEPEWLDLSRHVPQPATHVSDVQMLGGGAVVSTRGRGVFFLANLRRADPASYFVVNSSAANGAGIAVLHRSDGSVLPWGRVRVEAKRVNDGERVINVLIRSEADGSLRLPSALPAGDYRIELRFEGDGSVAPSATRFVLTIS